MVKSPVAAPPAKKKSPAKIAATSSTPDTSASTPTEVENPPIKEAKKQSGKKPTNKKTEAPTPAPAKKAKATKKPKTDTPPATVEAAPEVATIYRLTERKPNGLKPLFVPAVEKGSPVDLPAGITALSLVEWMERLVDYYAAKSLWITNGGLRFWLGWLKTGGWHKHASKHPTDAEHKLIQSVLGQCIENRSEPVEWNNEIRNGKFMEQHGLTASGKPIPGAHVQPSAPGKTPTKGSVKQQEDGTTAAKSTGNRGGKRFTWDGLPITSVLRWMGHLGWSKAEAREAMNTLGMEVADATIQAQISSGRKGDDGHHGKLPVLTKEQQKKIAALKK